jgi:endonuclease-3
VNPVHSGPPPAGQPEATGFALRGPGVIACRRHLRGAQSATTAPSDTQARAVIVAERLKAEYPARSALVHRSPFELLVATILSARTTDERVNQVTPVLFARYPSVEDLAAASLADVEDIIRPTGFFRSKARALVEISQDLIARHGGEVPPRIEDLLRLRGVGRKTANVVLGIAYGIPAAIVDTHVARVTRRLGLTCARDPVRIEADLRTLLPPAEWTGLSLRLTLHGRRLCTARDPRHRCCVLRDICPSADRIAVGTAIQTDHMG